MSDQVVYYQGVHPITVTGWTFTDVTNVPKDQLERSVHDKEELFERITKMLTTGHRLHLQDYYELLERLVVDLTERKDAAKQELDKHKQWIGEKNEPDGGDVE